MDDSIEKTGSRPLANMETAVGEAEAVSDVDGPGASSLAVRAKTTTQLCTFPSKRPIGENIAF